MTKRFFKGSTMLNPLPVVLITSMNNKGNINVFTVAWTGTVCTRPPMVSISIRPERLSYEYIKDTGEFVINLPTRSLSREVDYCGVKSGRDVDKIQKTGFTLEKSNIVKVPSIKECPISIECRVKDIIPLGSHDLFLSDVLSTAVDELLIDQKQKIHFEKANLICYSHGEYYPLTNNALGKFGFSIKKKK